MLHYTRKTCKFFKMGFKIRQDFRNTIFKYIFSNFKENLYTFL